jgi:hypothetical protein
MPVNEPEPDMNSMGGNSVLKNRVSFSGWAFSQALSWSVRRTAPEEGAVLSRAIAKPVTGAIYRIKAIYPHTTHQIFSVFVDLDFRDNVFMALYHFS